MKFALVFPGQGSQSVGMLADFPDFPIVRSTFQEASDALGEDLVGMVDNGPAEQLALTTNTQPIMLAAGIAVYRAFRQAGGPAPAFVAGHSLGEYAALVAAEVIDFAAAIRLVRLRADAMQRAVPVGTGGMAAILGLDAAAVASACEESAQGDVVEAVNFNDPVQIVIAGHKDAVDRACEACKARGAKRAIILTVSAPFHSTLMKPAADTLATALDDMMLREPRIAVVNNVDTDAPVDPAMIRDALIRQAYHPVRWVEVIEKMRLLGAERVFESGPGKVLSGLTRRIDRALDGGAITDQESLLVAVEAVK
jgi:[acyl-carrier-protein] S-malonyltransferase